MDDTFATLEAEYCPALDPALFAAIVSDFDLSKEDEVANVRATLDSLKESAPLEEAAGFDPSGTGGQDAFAATSEDTNNKTKSSPDTSASRSQATDQTSLSNGVASLDLGSSSGEGGAYLGELDILDEDMKVMILQDVTQDRLSRYNILHTLRKCNGNCTKALDELLNHVYIHEAENGEDGRNLSAKGIDGFSEDNGMRRARKTKAKNRRRLANSLPVSPEDDAPLATNKWQHAIEHVEFISSRTGLSETVVKSLYNKNNASMPQTINALLKQTMEDSKTSAIDDPAIEIDSKQLGVDFPSITAPYLTALISITYPSTAAAHELAKVLVSKPRNTASDSTHIVPMYARPAIIDVDVPIPSHLRRNPAIYNPSLENSPASQRADAYATARAQAFAQAGVAYRRAKSNHLMGGAAAYYSQRAHDLGSLQAGANAAASDQLAAQQSTPTSLDLHGIDVANAVRIARESVEAWWAGLGEARVNGRVGVEERSRGFRIVVGLGRHSEGGKSKLGPAVGAMLRNEGWKSDGNGGEILVRGRQRG